MLTFSEVIIVSRADGAVIINTRLDTKGLSKGVGNLKSQFADLGTAVGKLGGMIATAFSVRAVVNFSKEAIKLGSDLQEVQNVVDVTFTTMNEQVNKFAKNAMQTAGLSETMAKRYAGTFGAMAKSFKFSEEESYAMATSLTQLSGDVASFYNLTQDAAYTKLKSVFTGETETLKDLGVVMTQTALDDFALRKGLAKTTSQMSEQEKVALRYQFVMEQLSGASGDFVRTQDSWANQTRILSLQFEQLKATLGQGLINVLTPALKLLNSLIAKAQEFAEAFRSMTESLFGDAGGSAKAAESISAGYASAADNAGALADATEEAAKEAKKYLAGFDEITQVGADQKTSIQGVGSIDYGNSSGEIKESAKQTSKLSKAVSALENALKPLQKISFTNVSESLGKLMESLQPYKDLVLDGLRWLWNDILVPLAEWTIEDLLPSFLNLVSEALDFLTPILEAIQPTLDWLWNDIFVPMAEFVGQSFIDFLGLLTDAFSVFGDWASENKETVNEIFQAFLGFLAGVWVYNTTKKIIDFIHKLGPAFVELGNKLATGGLKSAFFAAAIGILAAGIIALAANWDKMSPAERVITILTALAAAATAAAIAIALFHTSWSVGLAAAAIAGGVALLGLSFAFNDSGKTGDAAKTAADNFYSSYDWDKDFSLPALAKGAVLPPNKPFLAMVGDQRHGTNIEAPLSTIQEAVAEVMADYEASNLAGHEATVEVLRQLLSAVLGIEVGDTTIGQAANRYNRRMAITTGGL